MTYRLPERHQKPIDVPPYKPSRLITQAEKNHIHNRLNEGEEGYNILNRFFDDPTVRDFLLQLSALEGSVNFSTGERNK